MGISRWVGYKNYSTQPNLGWRVLHTFIRFCTGHLGRFVGMLGHCLRRTDMCPA